MHHPASRGEEWGKHRWAIDSSWHSRSHQQRQTAWTQRGENMSRKQTFAAKVVPSSQIKEYLLCSVPSLHQVHPLQVFHHRLLLQYLPFSERKNSLWNQPTAACIGWFVVDGLHVKKNTSASNPSRYFTYSPISAPFISLSAKNMLLVIISSNRHVRPHCGYCKSSLEATRMRDHRKF